MFLLMQVLSPRHDIGIYGGGKNKKKKLKEGEKDRRDSETNSISTTEYRTDEIRDPAAIVSYCPNFYFK